MVSRARSRCSNRIELPRASATALCSSWVRPRSASSWRRAPARSAGLEKRCSPSAKVWSAPSTRRPGRRAATVRAFSRASSAATSPALHPGLPCSIARSSRSAGSTSTGSPASRRMSRRIVLLDASTRGWSASQSGIAQATGWRRRSVRKLITAAAVSSIERRVTSMLGQLCLAHSLRENATSSATALRSIYWSSS